MPYDRSLDGFQHYERSNGQLRLAPTALQPWFEPLNDDRQVPLYATDPPRELVGIRSIVW